MADHPLFDTFDPTAGVYTYAYYDDVTNLQRYLKTSGSSTTVSELSASDNTFQGSSVGDILYVTTVGPAVTSRKITSISGVPDSVTVATAVDWENGGNGRAASVRRWHSGTTAATDGWFFCSNSESKSIVINVVTLVATSVDWIINGDVFGVSVTLDSGSISATGTTQIVIAEDVRRLQVGLKATGAGTDSVSVVYRATPKLQPRFA